MNGRAQSFVAGLLSLLFLGVFLGIWHLATLPKKEVAAAQDEYAKLMGKGTKKSDGFPTLGQLGETAIAQLKDPLYDRGANDKGIGIQLGWSLMRVAAGYALAILVAVPLGFLIGMSPLLYRALNPFIQLLKPISPLAWMVVVAAEMLAVDSGLGYLIIDSRNAGKRYDLVVAGMLMIGVIGLGLDLLMRRLERLPSVRWGFREG